MGRARTGTCTERGGGVGIGHDIRAEVQAAACGSGGVDCVVTVFVVYGCEKINLIFAYNNI